MKPNNNSKKKLNDFKKKDKFKPESEAPYYQGLSAAHLQPILSELMNKAADDFIKTANNYPSDKKFQANIKTSLDRLSIYYLELDTEDREKVCLYFEELMDCVGLESSDGLLNKWMYGFDPVKKE